MVKKPKVKPISRMLDDPNKEIHKTYGSVGLLSKLWRVILKDTRVSGYRFSMLMDRFLNDPKNHVPDNPKERFNNRGNLNKEFSNPTMSWKVFCKCMRFMQFLEFRITLEARHHDGTITTHRVMVNLNDGLKDVPMFDEELADNPDATMPKRPDDQEQIPFLDDEDDDDDDNNQQYIGIGP
jgi:hypothetical protein